ncbi:MAG: glycosyltransferase family 4 protein [Candidatus Kapaibacterium sp.]
MTILQLTPRMPYPLTDGGAIGIYNITKSLAELGHKITLVTFPLEDEVETREAVEAISKYAKVEMVSKPLPARWKVLLRTTFRGAYPIERRMMPEMFALLKQLMAREKFDIVHVDHAHMGKYGLWLKQEYSLPIVLREHNFEALIYERFSKTEPNPIKAFIARIHGKRLKRQEVEFLKHFDAIAAITQDDAKIMRNYAPDANIHIIPAGVDTEYFRPTTQPEDPDKLLWVGSLEWDPNYDAVRYFLTEIFPLVLDRRPTTKFDVIGTDSDRVRKLTAGFGNRVRLLGRVPDVRDFLAHSAVLVVPLRIGGGMRLKLLDFFAAGKASVATSIAAEGNIAQHGRELLIADTPESFAGGVLELLSNEELRRALGTSGRELVMREYSWKKIAKDLTGLYESVRALRTIPSPAKFSQRTQ